jgi:hypothetical protein
MRRLNSFSIIRILIILKLLLKTYAILSDSSISMWKYCLNAWLLTTIPALLFMKAIALVFNIGDSDKVNSVHFDDLFNIFKNIILNPAIETFIIAFFIHWLKQFFDKKIYIILVSTLLFAALHFRFEYPFWFFGVLWPAFMLSTVFLTWEFISFRKAYIVCTVIHILHNATVYLLALFFDVFK